MKISECDPAIGNAVDVNMEMLHEIAKTLGYSVVDVVSHRFEPQGMTGMLILNESHISIHTWPESTYAVVNLLTCKAFDETHKAALKACIEAVYTNAIISILIQR